MIILGITGGSGCGKTTVSDYFRKSGIDVIDTDKVARLIVKKGTPALFEIKQEFGEEYLDKNDELDRKKLAQRVFNNKDDLEKLNSITHKYISSYVDTYINSYKGNIIGIDGALLIESSINEKCDYLISVLADKKIRIERIVKRDNISQKNAKDRISAQKDDMFYIEKSDFWVYNDGNHEDLYNQLDEILNKIRSIS